MSSVYLLADPTSNFSFFHFIPISTFSINKCFSFQAHLNWQLFCSSICLSNLIFSSLFSLFTSIHISINIWVFFVIVPLSYPLFIKFMFCDTSSHLFFKVFFSSRFFSNYLSLIDLENLRLSVSFFRFIIFSTLLPRGSWSKYFESSLTAVECDKEAPFLIATTPRCREGLYFFLWTTPFSCYPYLIMLSVI